MIIVKNARSFLYGLPVKSFFREIIMAKRSQKGSRSRSFLPESTPPPENRNVIDLTGEDQSKPDSNRDRGCSESGDGDDGSDKRGE